MHQIYDQIIDLVKNNISNIKDNHIQFSDLNYKPFNFDQKNFNSRIYASSSMFRIRHAGLDPASSILTI